MSCLLADAGPRLESARMSKHRRGSENMDGKRIERGGMRPNWKARTRHHAWIAALAGLVVLFVGNAAAAPMMVAAADARYSAPYTGQGYGSVNDYSTGCGVAMSAPVLPTFNVTTGRTYESVKSTASSCGTQNGTGNVQAIESYFSLPITIHSSGLHKWISQWVADFSVKLAASPGSPSQEAQAGFSENENFELLDLTNGSAFFPTTVPYVSTYISSGTYSIEYSHLHQSVYLNATLAKGHMYEFVAEIYIYVYVLVTPGTSTASAYVNMGSDGRHAVLESVTDR